MTLCPPHSRIVDNEAMDGVCEGCLFARITILEEHLDRIGAIADTCENLLAAAGLPLPAHIHMQGIKGGLEKIRDEANAIYYALGGKANGGEDYEGQFCGDCDGVGWCEGGVALQTTCRKCNGTGIVRRT
jgi:hypothetical protein